MAHALDTEAPPGSYEARFRELRRHARELVARHAEATRHLEACEAELAAARAGPGAAQTPGELHDALAAARASAASAEAEARRLRATLTAARELKRVDVARRRRQLGPALARALGCHRRARAAAAAKGLEVVSLLLPTV